MPLTVKQKEDIYWKAVGRLFEYSDVNGYLFCQPNRRLSTVGKAYVF